MQEGACRSLHRRRFFQLEAWPPRLLLCSEVGYRPAADHRLPQVRSSILRIVPEPPDAGAGSRVRRACRSISLASGKAETFRRRPPGRHLQPHASRPSTYSSCASKPRRYRPSAVQRAAGMRRVRALRYVKFVPSFLFVLSSRDRRACRAFCRSHPSLSVSSYSLVGPRPILNGL